MDLTSEVSVMRQGEIVGHTKTETTNREKLAEMMVGRSVLLRINKSKTQRGDVAFRVENLTVKDDLDVTRVKNINLEINKMITGFSAFDQKKIDNFLIKLDGTENKKRLGANAILAVKIGLSLVTLVAGDILPCSNSTFIPF